jgi:cellulose synthase/poly-beta-1,6-N-acetylglucosamine synthase-like glycosyltransferase
MLKLSRKQFYNNHFSEIDKYTQPNSSVLHITSALGEEKFNHTNYDTLYIDSSKDLETQVLDLNEEKYDLIVVTDIFEVFTDVYQFVKFFKNFLKKEGKILLTSINPRWNILFKVFETIGLKRKSQINSYINPRKISNIFFSLNFEKIRSYNRQIFPFRILGVGKFLNIFLEIFLSYFNLGIKTYFLYQLKEEVVKDFTKSIIVPAKNESGNLNELVNRIPKFSARYEIIIVCGPSKDNTFETATLIKNEKKELDIVVFEQTKNGKANAVWEAIYRSKYDAIAILDADISVDPEELTNFFDVLENTNCDFVNGTRLMYPMEDSAMRYLNKIGNRSFQFLISKLISVNLSDTLCGTKIFKKSRIDTLYSWQNKLTISDPFCDFDLIFSSAYSGAKILEYPVHYRSRKYGKTNISRFRDGWKLILYFFNSLILFKSSNY